MKPVTVAECDPELEAALIELRFVVPQYRALRQKFLRAHADLERYRELAAIKYELADVAAVIRSHADRTKLSFESLVAIVEAAAPLTGQVRGKRKSPAMNALLANVATAETYAAKADEEAREELALASYAARESARRLARLGQGREYLEASLG